MAKRKRKPHLPLIDSLRPPGVSEQQLVKHWEKLERAMAKEGVPPC